MFVVQLGFVMMIWINCIIYLPLYSVWPLKYSVGIHGHFFNMIYINNNNNNNNTNNSTNNNNNTNTNNMNVNTPKYNQK